MTPDGNKNQSTEVGLDLAQIIELANSNDKIAIIYSIFSSK